jgi:hypothetical protein
VAHVLKRVLKNHVFVDIRKVSFDLFQGVLLYSFESMGFIEYQNFEKSPETYFQNTPFLWCYSIMRRPIFLFFIPGLSVTSLSVRGLTAARAS